MEEAEEKVKEVEGAMEEEGVEAEVKVEAEAEEDCQGNNLLLQHNNHL